MQTARSCGLLVHPSDRHAGVCVIRNKRSKNQNVSLAEIASGHRFPRQAGVVPGSVKVCGSHRECCRSWDH
jgi:hypothetical protein